MEHLGRNSSKEGCQGGPNFHHIFHGSLHLNHKDLIDTPGQEPVLDSSLWFRNKGRTRWTQTWRQREGPTHESKQLLSSPIHRMSLVLYRNYTAISIGYEMLQYNNLIYKNLEDLKKRSWEYWFYMIFTVFLCTDGCNSWITRPPWQRDALWQSLRVHTVVLPSNFQAGFDTSQAENRPHNSLDPSEL